MDIFHQKAFAEISDQNSKMRTYGLIKSEIGEEPYLRIVKNVKDRISMTKFRLSNHKLMIEKGRHHGLEKEERICPFCTSVEDEIHFLTECEVFTPLRRDLLTQAQNISKSPLMRHLQGKDLFKFLLQRED